jgi:hypothetical protein
MFSINKVKSCCINQCSYMYLELAYFDDQLLNFEFG